MRARNPHIRNYFDFTLSAYQDGGIWQTQRELLRRIRRQAEARGGTLVAVTFPFLHSLGPAYRFRDVHRLLGEFWSSEGVPRYMFNFKEISEALIQADGGVMVKDKEDLYHQLQILLSDRQRAAAMGERAFSVIAANSGATARTIDRIGGLIGGK